jgi:hypothetical protein
MPITFMILWVAFGSNLTDLDKIQVSNRGVNRLAGFLRTVEYHYASDTPFDVTESSAVNSYIV